MGGYDIPEDINKQKKAKKEKVRKEKIKKAKKEKTPKSKPSKINPISQESNDTGFLPIPPRNTAQLDDDFSPNEQSPFLLNSGKLDMVESREVVDNDIDSDSLNDDFEIIPPVNEETRREDGEQW